MSSCWGVSTDRLTDKKNRQTHRQADYNISHLYRRRNNCRDDVWVADSGGPKEPCDTYPQRKGQFWGLFGPFKSTCESLLRCTQQKDNTIRNNCTTCDAAFCWNSTCLLRCTWEELMLSFAESVVSSRDVPISQSAAAALASESQLSIHKAQSYGTWMKRGQLWSSWINRCQLALAPNCTWIRHCYAK